ncbi:MAG: hypothetical protein JRJ04_18050, partial [Deltaproteobacteria bacterium]|nr:hypothetical protein [Deltaproteobacteria bacterium]
TVPDVAKPTENSHFHGKIHAGHSKMGKGSKMHAGRPMMKKGPDQHHKTGGQNAVETWGAEDSLLYMVAYKDASTGEYHCATLPMKLRMWSYKGSSQTKWRSRSNAFAFWGIMGGVLGIAGVGGGVYRKRKRDRETIF